MRLRVPVLLITLVAVAGCTPIEDFRTRLVWLKGVVDQAIHKPEPSPSPNQELRPHAERLIEMWRVVMLEDPAQNLELERELPAWVNALSQGARIEGVYQGLVRSDRYRELERRSAGPSKAIGVFSREILRIQRELSEADRRVFTTRDAEPLARPVMPDTLRLEGTLGREPPQSIELTETALMEGFEKASVFTLKRVWCEELLRYFRGLEGDRKKLAQAYSKWVEAMSVYPVDLGLEARANKDPEFHREWAMTAPLGVLYWEILNRAHRVLNEANR